MKRARQLFSAALVAAAAAPSALPALAEDQSFAPAGRLERRAQLVLELVDEGALDEARSEMARLRREPFWKDAALDDCEARLGRQAAAEKQRTDRAPNGGFGSFFARATVFFYKKAVSPALGARCGLEPSCSRFFAIAARKHGWLAIPMTADRFVREPVVSAPDRPWVRTDSGTWKHPDPVEDHDWWFAK